MSDKLTNRKRHRENNNSKKPFPKHNTTRQPSHTYQNKPSMSKFPKKPDDDIFPGLLRQNKLFKQALDHYNAYSRDYDLEDSSNRYNKYDSEFKWTIKMLQKGTFDDKISSLVLHIRKSPRQTLKYLDMLTKMAKKKNKRQRNSCVTALKELYLKDILENRKYKPFLNSTQEDREYTKDELINFYIDDFLHRKYFEFIEFIEESIRTEEILSIKKQMINLLMELLKAKPEREDYLLDSLVYKLGDPKPEVSNHAIKVIKDLQEAHSAMTLVICQRLKVFINGPKCNEAGKFHSLVLISMFRLTRDDNLLKFLLDMFFDLFNSYVNEEDEKYWKFLEVVIKVIYSVCRLASDKVSSII